MVIEIGEPIRVAVPDGSPRREAVLRTAEAVAEGLAAHVQAAVERHGVALPSDDPRVD